MLQLTNLAFSKLVLELRPRLENAFMNKVQQLDTESFRFRLHAKEGSLSLISNKNALWLSSYKFMAFPSPGYFAKKLDSALYNKKILSISQHGSDRIIVLEFAENFLVFEFFHDSNIILTDKENMIVACLRKEEWADRRLAAKEKYIFPKSKGKNPADFDFPPFEEIFKSEGKAIISLINSVNIAPLIAEEIFERHSISRNEDAKSLSERQIKAVFAEMQKIYSLHDAEGVYLKKGHLLPFALKGAEKLLQGTINDALDESLSRLIAKDKENSAEAKNLDEIGRIEASIKRQHSARTELEKKSEDNRRKGELIYENYSALEELSTAVKTALGKKYAKKEILQRLKEAESKGSRSASLIQDIDLKEKKITVEL